MACVNLFVACVGPASRYIMFSSRCEEVGRRQPLTTAFFELCFTVSNRILIRMIRCNLLDTRACAAAGPVLVRPCEICKYKYKYIYIRIYIYIYI